ncbi:thiamine-phosphate pyrophosphorylase [Hathewaya proteolytica DSM 3090]|uniref:Thiamine-phosphate pyrophosphorylase n=1 Tax=Hathewaya proteolytica DSM 3090 TaxID=1121331 RepID=A0A1M6JDS9_9CLOT|nr:thiamine phosphate synthase [Hathewaya proteolytica]SHJ44899.1 thiamine-phosphate pyrophosphorylase [Hathewaya proteolytica DSM 3090]
MLYVVTNLGLAKNERSYYHIIKQCFLNNIEALVIREKHLVGKELDDLCNNIYNLRGNSKTKVMMNCNSELNLEYALKYNFNGVQVPYNLFMDKQSKFNSESLHGKYKNITIGVSVHSADEGISAFYNKAEYITVGHIFKTQCKEGLMPRGVEIIEKIREQNKEGRIVAIGGINEHNAIDVINSGADSFAMMSQIMCNEDIERYLIELKRKLSFNL